MKKVKKCLSVILAVIMLFHVMPFGTLTVRAAGSSLASLKSQYPEGSTWKSSYDGATQCHGWALMVADKAYGYTASSADRCRNRTRVYNTNSLKSGDVIRVYRSSALSDSKAHTIFVTDVSGNTITFADCNWDWNCGIRWDETISKTSLTNGTFGYGIQYVLSAPYEWEGGEHTHSYTGARVYETVHPHAITQRCVDYASCGGYKDTGENAQVKTCKQCWYASFDLSASSISIKVGESKTISATINGFWPDTRVAICDYDTSRVDVTVGQNTITFKGLKTGTCTFKLIVYSDDTKTHIIGSKSIPVTVSEPTYTGKVSFDKSLMSLVMPTNQTDTLTIALSGTWPDGAGYTFDYDSDIISVSQSGTTLTITAKNAGSTNFTMNIVNKNNNNALITYAVCPITVKKATYTIKYDANGGTSRLSFQTKTYDVTLPISTVEPERSGYEFLGWSRSKNSTAPEYLPGDSFTINADTTLYAVWRQITLTSIKVYWPDKVSYYMGESLDTSGLKLRLEYSDGSTSTIDSGYTISGFDSSTEGYKTVTVSYGGKSDKFEVYIIASSVSLSETSLEMNVGEINTIYANTDPIGESVKWSVSNNSVVTVSNGKITAVGAGTATVTATFYYNGYYSFATCDVTVKAIKSISSISVSNMPTKTVYEIGEELDTSGLKLKLTWSDGTITTTALGFTTSGFSSVTAGTKTVTVSCGGKTTTFTVTVNEPEPDIDENAPQIVLESKKVTIGEEFTVAVELKNNPGFNAASIKIEYDNNKLQLINAELSEAFSTGANVSYDNLPYLTFIRSNDVDYDAVLLILTFKALDVGDVKLSIEYDEGDISNSKEEDVNFKVVGGTIEIAQYTPGDINDDGKVNTKDLTRLLKYINHENVEYNEQALDVNGDGKVNTKDLTRLLRYINRENVEIF